MDSKIILAILIVALIGIVAATYQTETDDVISTLSNVATEDSDIVESVTDIAQTSAEQVNSVEVDENVVQPDSNVNTKIETKQKESDNNINKVPATQTNSKTKKQVQTSTNTNTQQKTNNNAHTNTTNSNNISSAPTTTKISQTEAISIAKNNLKDWPSNYQKVSETTINGKPYYIVNMYQDGEIIASFEIDANNGKITGGGVKGEAPEVD